VYERRVEARAVHVVVEWLAMDAATTTFILHGKLAILYTLGLQYRRCNADVFTDACKHLMVFKITSKHIACIG